MRKKLPLLFLLITIQVAAIQAQVNVTLQVDMTGETVGDNGVNIAGWFNNWNSDATPLADPDGDGIYSVVISWNSGDYHEYKFINKSSLGDTWETPGDVCSINTNRFIVVPSGDVTLPAAAFNGCASEGVSEVTFSVDLNGATPSVNGVHVTGSMIGWNPGRLALTIDPTDSDIYSVTKQFIEGEYMEYKFINDNDWLGQELLSNDCQISGNRFLRVPSDDVSLAVVPFDGCAGTSVTFQVDLGSESPSVDGVHLVGNFNNWNPGNVEMTNTGGSIYAKTLIFAYQDDIEYKFVNGNGFGVAETPGVPCSVNTNREYTVGASDETLSVTDFGGCDFDYVKYVGAAWSNGSGPGASDIVSIEEAYSGTGFECDDLYVNGDITTSSTSSFTINGDLINESAIDLASGSSLITMGEIMGGGTFTIHRNTTFDESTGRYSIVGSPVESATTSDLGSLVYAYDESQPYGTDGVARFDELAAGTALEVGKGYFSAYTGAMEFTGTPNNGDIPVALTYNAGTAAGFNLLSNPYPSAIDAGMFSGNNLSAITGTLYLWDDEGSDTQRGDNNDYMTVTGMGVTGNITNLANWDGYIRSGQGFFVLTQSTGNSVLFTDDMKDDTNSDGGFFRASEVAKMRIIISNDEFISDALVGFTDEATLGIDKGLDAIRFNSNNKVSVFTVVDDNQYVIRALPFSDELTTVQLGFSAASAGEYSLSLANDLANNFSTVELYDAYTKETIELTAGSNEVSFTTEAGTFTDRFSILTSNSFTVAGLNLNAQSYPFKASVYSIKGELLREVTFEHAQQFDLLRGLENQLLIMKTDRQTQKLWIQK